jgi:hypothetical protein
MIRSQEGRVIPVWAFLLHRESHTNAARCQSRAPRGEGTARVLPSGKADLTCSPAAIRGLSFGSIRSLWQQAGTRPAESQLESHLPVNAVPCGPHRWTGPCAGGPGSGPVQLVRDRPRHNGVGGGLRSRLCPQLRCRPGPHWTSEPTCTSRPRAPGRVALGVGFDCVAGKGPGQQIAEEQHADPEQLADRPRLQVVPCAPLSRVLVDRGGEGAMDSPDLPEVWLIAGLPAEAMRTRGGPLDALNESRGRTIRDHPFSADGPEMVTGDHGSQTRAQPAGSQLCSEPGSGNRQHRVSTWIPMARERSGLPARASRIQDDRPDH